MITTTARRAAVYGRESAANTKSIEDQVRLGVEEVRGLGWTHAGSYDDGTSASRYARKDRPGWTRLVADLSAGAFDVLVLWETTRGSREPIGWFTLLNLCRERGVVIHVISDDRTYDPRRARDFKDLASAGVDGAYETDRTSERVQRGHSSAARSGRPAMGRAPYGYRRTYDPATGKLDGQEPDPPTAAVVAGIFAKVVAAVPLSRIVADLNAEGISSAVGGYHLWSPSRLRSLLRNATYAGLRVHRRYGQNAAGAPETFRGGWEPLVCAETFYAAQRVLDDPARTTNTRPGKQVHLLSFLAVCHAGEPLTVKKSSYYTCHGGHVVADKPEFEQLVAAAVVEALADPGIYARLRQAGEVSDAEAQAARDEAAALRARLADYRKRARAGAIDPDDFAEISAGLRADIAAAEDRHRAVLPPALRPFTEPGADVEARWDDATLPAKREVIRALCTVTVHPAGKGRRVPLGRRVEITPAGLQTRAR